MAEDQQRRTLLGRLAGLGWFTRRGEVAATQALVFLLEEPELKHALLRHLEQVTQTELGAVECFRAEVAHDDGGRTDLEGQDAQGRPLVVVEAKFGAKLTSDQVRAYLNYLENEYGRLNSQVHTALILLVPSYRRPEAESVLRALDDRAHQESAQSVSVATAVVTWDEWLDVWNEAAQELPDEQDSVLCDLRQLRDLCRTMVALDIPPLGKVAVAQDWEERESDLRRLVTQVTVQLSDPSRILLPVRHEPHLNFFFRYIPGSLQDPDCYCAVGVAGALASEKRTPFWLRYHKDTSSFQEISERIMASRFRPDAIGNDGHLWLPLQVPDDLSGAAIIDVLITKIEEIRAVAAGREAP